MDLILVSPQEVNLINYQLVFVIRNVELILFCGCGPFFHETARVGKDMQWKITSTVCALPRK